MAESSDPVTSLSTGSEPVFDVVCFPCSSEGKIVEAEGYCQDCCEYLCINCIGFHKKFSMTKHHMLLDKQNMPDRPGTPQIEDVCTERCQLHKDEIIKYFCPIHKVLGCNVCVTLKHSRCDDVSYISEIAPGLENSGEYKEFMAKLDGLTQKSKDNAKFAEEGKKQASDCQEKAIEKIDAFRKDIMDAVDNQVKEMKDRARQIHTQDTGKMSSLADESNEILNELQAVSSDMSSLQCKKQFCQMFFEMKNTYQRMSELQDKLEDMTGNDVSEYNFQPDQQIPTMIRRQSGIGQLVMKSPEESATPTKGKAGSLQEGKSGSLSERKADSLPERNTGTLEEGKPCSLPKGKSVTLPEGESSSLPKVEASSLPKIESSSLSKVESSSLPKVESSSLPKVESSSLSKVESSSLPKVESSSLPKAVADARPKVEPSSLPKVVSGARPKEESGSLPKVVSGARPKGEPGSLPKGKHGSRTQATSGPLPQYNAGPMLQAKSKIKADLKQPNVKNLRQMKATYIADISVKSSKKKSICHITGVALMSTERLVAADFNSNRIKLIDIPNKKIISELKPEKKPWDVTVCGVEVAVTLPDASKIVFLTCKDRLVRVRDISVNGHCIGIDCADGKLFVTYDNEMKLEVMTVKGTVLQLVDKNNQGAQLFTNPKYVTVSSVNQSIYVTEWVVGRMTVLGLDGKVKKEYRDDQLSYPRQLAADSAGVVYLCDRNNNTIHLLSPLFEKVKSLLTSKDGLTGPRSICYCENTRRLYIGLVGDIIKVYQVS